MDQLYLKKIINKKSNTNFLYTDTKKSIKEPKTNQNQSRNSQKTTNYKKQKSSFSFSNIILWILFFPFKLAWWILKNIWKDDHMGNRKWDKF